jgi:succinate dehydrogenase/fumarate reductase cytochrome b subunit
MLLEFIARYYKLMWLGLGAIAFLKIFLSYAFHGNLEGTNGVIYALFKWYGEEEQEMEDVARRRTMRIHNIVTLLLYVAILIIIAATLLPMFLGH